MITELYDDKIEEFKYNNKTKKIIYFYSSYNPKSLIIKNILEEIEEIYEDRDNIKFYKIDCSYNPSFVKLFHIENIPTILFINEDNKIINFLEKEIHEETIIDDLRKIFPIKSTFKEIILNTFKRKSHNE